MQGRHREWKSGGSPGNNHNRESCGIQRQAGRFGSSPRPNIPQSLKNVSESCSLAIAAIHSATSRKKMYTKDSLSAVD